MRLLPMTLAVAMICGTAVRADQRFVFEPSLQLNAVHDDNLNFSIDDPLSDRVDRVTPGLSLRLESQRFRILTAYSLDSERYMKHSNLDSDLARQRAAIALEYEATERLTLAMSSAYVDTNTLADLNTVTGLAASRVHGRRLSFAPSATWRISPLLSATAAASSSTTNVVNGVGIRTQTETLGLERRATLRDRFSLDYEHSHLAFSGASAEGIETHAVLGGWTHDFGARDRMILQAGPRMTGHAPSLDVAASLTHSYRHSTVGLSYARTQATVVGYPGTVETESLQGHFSYSPARRLSAFIDPAVIRSTHNALEGKVLRGSIGLRYAITSLIDADVAYNRDVQNGAIDPLRPDAQLSHSILSIGLSSRWKKQ